MDETNIKLGSLKLQNCKIKKIEKYKIVSKDASISR